MKLAPLASIAAPPPQSPAAGSSYLRSSTGNIIKINITSCYFESAIEFL